MEPFVSETQVGSYLALCYHYVRPDRQSDRFPRLLGTGTTEFRAHVEKLLSRFRPISLENARALPERTLESGATGILFTFDDGLSDHLTAAEILHSYGVKAAFFIPTCILVDGEPANPTIIHYALAKHPIREFLAASRRALEKAAVDPELLGITFANGDDPWQTIREIKSFFKSRLSHALARKTLLIIYEDLVAPALPSGLGTMHLLHHQIEEIIAMGHTIGVHSHSHVSIGAADLTAEEFRIELVEPRRLLQDMFSIPVYALSYPFGHEEDCLSAEALMGLTNEYDLAFTVAEVLNTPHTSPLQLGRYMPHSTDTASDLLEVLSRIRLEHHHANRHIHE